MVLFIVHNKVTLTFESVDEILKCDHLIKATEQYFQVVLFFILNKVVLRSTICYADVKREKFTCIDFDAFGWIG